MDSALRFSGTKKLYGNSAFAKIQSSHICIVGLGGVGSWACESFVRSGIGELTLIDLDDICITNSNRQIHALSSTLGKQKIETLKSRILDINPACKVNLINDFVNFDNIEEIFKTQYSYILDAIDNFRLKSHMAFIAKKNQLKILTVGASGGKCNPKLIQSCDLAHSFGDKLLKKVKKDLRQNKNFPRENEDFNIKCVFNPEPAIINDDNDKSKNNIAGKLDCETGFGSVMFMTASLGLYASGIILNDLADYQKKSLQF